MKIIYQVNDGYVGGYRPHYIEFSDEEFAGLTEKEALAMINSAIDDHFAQNISPFWDDQKYIKEIRALLDKNPDDEEDNA